MLKPCVICQRPGRFRVDHVPDGEHVVLSAAMCSLACVGIWTYRYGVHLSKQAAKRLLGIAGKTGGQRN